MLAAIGYVWVAGMWHDYLRGGLECYAKAHPDRMPLRRRLKTEAAFLIWSILWPLSWCCLFVTELLDWPELPYGD